MNIPWRNIVLVWSAVLGLSGCAQIQAWSNNQASQILNWYMWENTTTWDMAYREWTPVPNFDKACDTTQPIFDKTTWDALAIIDPNISQLAENNWDELVVLCDESKSWTDNIPESQINNVWSNGVYR